jgi:flagellar hook-associated protein 2
MGTVGLNFGSPTSGTGFDVTATVATIVGNLKNVETPWNTQLTALQKQDTAISSLGTLMSNLSNDMSQLTDLSGILAQKTGSSSDTNVVQLTAASASSTAGTHTIAVANLAKTSSGYLAPITNASDKLSGSISIQVGNGKAHTITLGSSNNTLDGLASAINSAGIGVTASVLADSSGSRLSLVSGTSGAGGNITIGANSITDTSPTSLSYTDGGFNTANLDTGTVGSVSNSGDKLTGTIGIQVGSTVQTITLDSSDNTLSTLADAINQGSYGVQATVVTSNGQSSLSLVSNTAGSAGALTVTPNITDATPALGYLSTVTGIDANLTVDGVNLTSSSNTVTDLIPGLTFQLLAPSAKQSDNSLEEVQVVIGNDIGTVESTLNTMVSDYNSLISAINVQQGLDSSGNSEPLFGSPTLSLLQQQLLGGLNTQNPSGNLDSIATNTNTTLSGSFTTQVGNGAMETFVIGAAPSSGAPNANTYYTGDGVNTLDGLAAAINAANSGTPLSYSGTAGSDTVTSSGTLTSAATDTALSGSMTVQVGDGTVENVVIGDPPSAGAAANTIYTGTDSGDNTIAGVAAAINNASGIGFTAGVTTDANGIATLALTSGTAGTDGTLTVTSSMVADGNGVTATVITNGTQSTLSLLSQTAGPSGALTMNSNIVATGEEYLAYSGSPGSAGVASAGTLAGVLSDTDALSGSVTIEAGSGTTMEFDMSTLTDKSLNGLMTAINDAAIGVTASVVQNTDSTWSLTLVSGTTGAAGNLLVASTLLDSNNTTSKTLSYTNSSDVTSLSGLGISTSQNADGTLSFDASSLTSVLNSDFSGVVGFFQNLNSWGQSFSTILNNAGSSSTNGILSLAASSNSSVESMLNASISKEESMISVQQKSLTAQLNSANEIMQQLPTQLDGINMLYSAITGYNSSKS